LEDDEDDWLSVGFIGTIVVRAFRNIAEYLVIK
jgi:hypothetical protein